MFSTSISSVPFALLITILQTLTAVSALPASTTTTASTSAQLETRQASDSNRNSNDNGVNDNDVDDNNTAASNRVTPAQVAGVVIGALCTIALALIFWYCFVQRQRKKRDLRDAAKKAATEHTNRAGL
ncbi:hypothetical protein C7212DRAFT_305531 [Tuber magnatum]|uniref:Mid2 domain-containing protein n=1 Tax=Tuber magnatum TaxID=42249 RepID=A0A317SZL7_9PEZI|nr:hypothetical protein C7212DRAFT_305531 [Tuber magnatum]